MRSVALVGELPGWLTYDFPDFVRARLRPGWDKYRGQAQKFYLFHFYGRDDEINLATRHREFSHWKWADLAAMPAQVIEFKRGVYERVAAAFAPRIEELRASGELTARRSSGGGGSGGSGGL
jgi:putative (di)nucleoside polyphosphate hydrolase